MTTREAIKNSFLRLLEERPLREITVKEIVGDCKVNRNSFYYHFKDIPALLEEIIRDYADGIIARQARSLADCLEAAASFAMEHRQAVLHINQSGHRQLAHPAGGPGGAGPLLSVRVLRPGDGLAAKRHAL